MIDTDLTGTAVHGMSVRRFVVMMTDASGDVTETVTATETQDASSGNDSAVVETATAVDTQTGTTGLVNAAKMQDFISGRLRGFALTALPDASSYVAQDFIDLVANGANVVRVPIILNRSGAAYTYPTADIAYVKQVLDYGVAYGFTVIVTLMPLPGGDTSEWWTNESLLASIISTWVAIAAEIKNYPALQAYDILNEPVGNTYDMDRKTLWTSIAQMIVTPLRAEDNATPIMVEPVWWALPTSFWQSSPVVVSGLVYSFHFYEPQIITHQGLPGYALGTAYPNATHTKTWLYDIMLEARSFAATFGVPMFVGEFSCIRWAPAGTALQWLTDAIDLFAAQGWGWTYHAWRGYDGWDSEIAQSVPQDTGVPADRSPSSATITLLRNAMAVGSSRNSVLVGGDASAVSPRRFVSLLATDSFSEVVEATSAVSTQDAVGGAQQPSAGVNIALTASVDSVSTRRFVTLLDTTSAPAEVAGKNTLLLGGDANAVSSRRFVMHFDEGTDKNAQGAETATAISIQSATVVSAGFSATLVGSANEDEVFLRRFVVLISISGLYTEDIAETASAADTRAATLSTAAAVAETISAADTSNWTAAGVSSCVEVAVAASTQSALSGTAAAVAETTTAADTSGRSVAGTSAAAEAASAASTQSAAVALLVAVQESANAIATGSGSMPGAPDVVQIENAVATDTASIISALVGSAAEFTLLAADTSGRALSTAAVVGEFVGAVESQNAVTVFQASLAELASLIDTSSGVQLTGGTNVLESASATSIQSATRDIVVSVVETANAAEANAGNYASSSNTSVSESTGAGSTQSTLTVYGGITAEAAVALDTGAGAITARTGSRAEVAALKDTSGAVASLRSRWYRVPGSNRTYLAR